MVLLTAAIFAIAATAPDAEVEKRLPLSTEEQQLIEETDVADELVLNDAVEESEEE